MADDLILNHSHDWPVYVNPGILLCLYITVTAVIKSGLHAAAKQVFKATFYGTQQKLFHSF